MTTNDDQAAGQLSPGGRRNLRQLSRTARERFAVSHMSDTKWRKLMRLLDEDGPGTLEVVVRFIDVEGERRLTLPRRGESWCRRPYIDTNSVGPIELRSIEWLEIPRRVERWRGRNVPPGWIEQDVDAVRALLERAGRFSLVETERGLRIEGHSR